MSNIHKTLKNIFGYDSFRGDQETIINHVMAGKNAFVLMPTGGGKSLCFQIPAICMDGVAVVVSPLIALMKDQVDALKQSGVKADTLNSSMSRQEQRDIEEDIRNGNMDIVYISPEKFFTQGFENLLNNSKISLFGIDEAHCVSQWGHDFRPEYAKLGEKITESWPNIPVIALTASADDRTKNDILNLLNIKDSEIFTSSFDRKNISYEVVEKTAIKSQLISFIRRFRGSGIVYCHSRKKVDKVTRYLQEAGFNALKYHAGMTTEERNKNQNSFILDDNVIVVATIAFGMGIDKPDVRFVAHTDIPGSIEAYYQETGRAGRDGMPSVAWVAYNGSDIAQRFGLLAEDRKANALRITKLNDLIAMFESPECRRKGLLSYFDEEHPGNCASCDRCLNPVLTYDGIIDVQKVLSAMKRTGEWFGGEYITDILLGKATTRIKEKKHDKLKTFGIGQGINKAEWKNIIRQMLSYKIIEADPEKYNGLFITKKGTEILYGKNTDSIQIIQPQISDIKAKNLTTANLPKERQILMDELRKLRTEIARKRRVAPYMIYSEDVINGVVSKLPKTKEELLQISGIGDIKAKQYGDRIITLVEKTFENEENDEDFELKINIC